MKIIKTVNGIETIFEGNFFCDIISDQRDLDKCEIIITQNGKVSVVKSKHAGSFVRLTTHNKLKNELFGEHRNGSETLFGKTWELNELNICVGVGCAYEEGINELCSYGAQVFNKLTSAFIKLNE